MGQQHALLHKRAAHQVALSSDLCVLFTPVDWTSIAVHCLWTGITRDTKYYCCAHLVDQLTSA